MHQSQGSRNIDKRIIHACVKIMYPTPLIAFFVGPSGTKCIMHHCIMDKCIMHMCIIDACIRIKDHIDMHCGYMHPMHHRYMHDGFAPTITFSRIHVSVCVYRCSFCFTFPHFEFGKGYNIFDAPKIHHFPRIYKSWSNLPNFHKGGPLRTS